MPANINQFLAHLAAINNCPAILEVGDNQIPESVSVSPASCESSESKEPRISLFGTNINRQNITKHIQYTERDGSLSVW